jgi:hypothetical protein
MIAQASPAAGPLRADPSKRVNYTLGLVLGVDEFQQDQLYHAAGRRGHNRLLHGYGTVFGLAVGRGGAAGDPEIQVEAGVAVDPCGREICVPDRMCVKLNGWMERHKTSLQALFPDPTAQPLPLAIVLCHRECQTDTVPVPGEPCRTQEDAMAASRIRDSFELKLVLRDDAPWLWPDSAAPSGLTVFRLSQPEEQAVRAFGLILARVQSTTDEALGADGEAILLKAVYDLRDAADESVLASPPAANDDPILLPAATAPDILRRALRLWVTEVRPEIRAMEDPGPCGQEEDGECCVLLAEIDLAVTGSWAISVNQPPIQEDRRPYLLHTRLLQEWLIAAGGEEGRPDVDSWASLQILGPNRVRVWVHHAEWVDVPREALSLVINDVELDPSMIVEVPYGGIRNVWDVVIARDMSDGDVVELRFDTEKVPLIEPPVARSRRVLEGRPVRPREIGKVSLEAEEVERVREDAWLPSTAQRTGVTIADELRGPSGEYLDRYGWTLSAFTVYDRIQGGDLEGEYKLPIVVKIQKFPVDPATPKAEQYLVSDGAKWLPRFLPDGTKDLSGRYPDSLVRGIQGFPVSENDPAADQYLVFNGTEWVPAFLPDGKQDLSGRYPLSTVIGLQKTPVANTPPQKDQYLFFDQPSGRWIPANLPDATGDLVGRYPSLEITRLQKNTVSAATPSAGQALAFVGGQWVPSGIPTLLGPAGGDLRGAYPAPSVVGLRGRPISSAAPDEGDVLVFRQTSPPGGQWVPEAIAFSADSDLGGAYPDNQLARLQGRTVDAANPGAGQVLIYEESSPPGDGRWVPGDLPDSAISGPAGGDLTNDYPNPRIARLQGRIVAATNPGPGQVLMYQESSPAGNGRWVPGDVAAGGGASGPATGDLFGTYPNPQVAGLRGRALNIGATPANGQVLTFRTLAGGGGEWINAPLPGVSGTAGGDLSQTYPNPRVAGLQGRPVTITTPQPGQVLTFRNTAAGGEWANAAPPAGGGAPTGPAAGDLGGAYPDPSVSGLQGVVLKTETRENGQFLRFSQEVWTPDWAVGAPGGAYEIIAAGRYSAGPGRADPLGQPYNGLKVSVDPGDQRVLLLNGFPFEPEQFQYIVKGTWEGGAVLLAPTTSRGLRVRLFQLDVENQTGELHLEVSRFPGVTLNTLRGGTIGRADPVSPKLTPTPTPTPTPTLTPTVTPTTTTTRTTRTRPPTG